MTYYVTFLEYITEIHKWPKSNKTAVNDRAGEE